MWPAAYCSRPEGIATTPPCGTLRASTARTRGSPRCPASHSISTKSRGTLLDRDRGFREVEPLLGVVGDVLADRERRGRSGRGCVAHVDDALRTFEHEVVDQAAVGGHRLCAHAGRTGEA